MLQTLPLLMDKHTCLAVKQVQVMPRQLSEINGLSPMLQEAEVVALPRIISKRWPEAGIDVLVNNAGLGRNNASLFEGSTQSWVEMVSTNVLGVCMCTREAVQVAAVATFQSPLAPSPQSSSFACTFRLSYGGRSLSSILHPTPALAALPASLCSIDERTCLTCLHPLQSCQELNCSRRALG